MRFKIPANTELEDRILPFLTMRQLIILSIWWVICYAIFQAMFTAGYVPAVWGTINFVVWGLFVASAFLKINHLEFHRWVALLISKLFIPQRRFFNNWLVWWQYFDVLNYVQPDKKTHKKMNLEIKNQADKKNDFDEMKNEIFWNAEKNIFNSNEKYELNIEEKEELLQRFW